MNRPGATDAFHVTKAGLVLYVRLTPKASRDAVGSVVDTSQGPALQVHVRAVPENNQANTALIALVAKWLGLPKSDLTLTAGSKSRLKSLAIAGHAPDIADRIRAAMPT